MTEYKTTKEECQRKCENLYCCRCGIPLSPIETVDNSRNPTFWPGCPPCRIFSYGTAKETYLIAKEINKDYWNIPMDDLCLIASRVIAAWQDKNKIKAVCGDQEYDVKEEEWKQQNG